MVCRSMHAASFAKPLKTILPTPFPRHCRFVAWAGPLRVSVANPSKPHTARNPFLYHMRFPSWVSAGCLNTKLKLHAKCDLRRDLELTVTHVRRTVKPKHYEPKWIQINKWFTCQMVNGSIVGHWLQVTGDLVTYWLPSYWLPGYWLLASHPVTGYLQRG